MSKNLLDEMLDGRGAKQTPSIKDVTAMLTGKEDKRSIPKSVKTQTKEQKAERSERISALKTERDGAEHIPEIDQINEIDQIDQIPEGFPEGTIMNDDGSLNLPDGRRIRKIEQGEDHEEAI